MRIAADSGRSRIIIEVPMYSQANALRASQLRMEEIGGKGRLQKEGEANN